MSPEWLKPHLTWSQLTKLVLPLTQTESCREEYLKRGKHFILAAKYSDLNKFSHVSMPCGQKNPRVMCSTLLEEKTARLFQFSSQMSTDCFRGLFRTKHAQIIPEQCPIFRPLHRKQLLQVSVHLFSSLRAEAKGWKHPGLTLSFKPPTVKRTRKISFPLWNLDWR